MLARKSRKHLVENGVVKCDLLKAAGYIRLSVNKSDRPSDSIENQKKIIEDYAKTNSDIQFERFYIDDKASGRDFDRSAFNEMLEDIRAGKINCVIVKDLSRLGRDMIDVGYYVQMFFPSKCVRFISITNKIDTLDGMTNIAFGKLPGDRIPLTSLMDEQYAIDISKKTQFVLDNYIKDGKYVAPRAPYGYRKSESDCHVLAPDMEAAAVVKEIFGMASRKISINEIVRRLNAAGIPTPINYAIAHGLEGNYNRGNGLWSSRTVKDILINRVYVGDLEQGKDKYVVQNTHEPLVSRDMFDAVQQLIAAPTKAISNKTNIPRQDNVLRGKVICNCCGGKMQRRKGSGKADWNFFTCISNNRLGDGHCTGMYIRESTIIDAIKAEIARYIEDYRSNTLDYKRNKCVLEERLVAAKIGLDSHLDKLQHSFEQNVRNQGSKEEFEQAIAEKRIAEQEVLTVENSIEQLEKAYQKYQLFNRAIMDRCCLEEVIAVHLERINIYSTDMIKVYWIL